MKQCLKCACDIYSEFATLCEQCAHSYAEPMYKTMECHKCGEDVRVPKEWPADQNMICAYCSGSGPVCDPEEDQEEPF